MKILLIGAGNMGFAMLKGLSKYDVSVVVKDKQKEQEVQKMYKNVKIFLQIPNFDEYIVLLAIKPNSLENMYQYGEAKGVISILAGTSIDTLRLNIKAKNYVRAMPSMAASIQHSATSLCGDENLKEDALKILSSIGKCFWLNNENELDIASSLAACSPAWLSLVAESLSDGAVYLGLKRNLSYEFIAEVFEGVGKVLKTVHPAILKDQVTSPNGTTIVGVKQLEKLNVRDAFMEAMIKSYEKSKQIKGK